jgi:hypothetical protein
VRVHVQPDAVDGLTGGPAEPPDGTITGSFPRIPTDSYTVAAIARGDLLVDHETGAVFAADGSRAERVTRDASGRVLVQRYPREVWAPAHRIVWIAVYGPIPDPQCTSVRHRNGLKWDNRPVNLYLSRQRGFITYPEAS